MAREIKVISEERIKLHYNAIHTINQLDIWDSRFFSCCLLGENQGVSFGSEYTYPVDIQKYAELSGMYYGEAFDKVKQVATKLEAIQLDIILANGTTHYITRLIHSIVADKEEKKFLIHWNENFIPLISGKMRPGEFITPLVHATTFGSNKRYCVYLLLEKHLYKLRTKTCFPISKEELRKAVGLKTNEYPEFRSVHAKIVKPALLDIYNAFGIQLVSKLKGNNILFSYKVQDAILSND